MDELFTLCISEAENNDLSKVPDLQEVRDVVWRMHPLKASGPDGLLGLFFKHYWPIVRDQVVAVVQSFFRFGSLLPQMNHTFITLIPKRIGACNFNQFKPISLCNFYYKIISKILVNKLRPLLPKIIEPTQTAFVPGRWIIENVVLAQEIVHCFSQSKKKKKEGNVGFKLDFHKAYDSLEWVFICRVLKAIGFDTKIIDLIFQCISIVSFTLLLNGCKSASFSPSKGIRQGDPFSLYLFILCSEVLARLINRDVERGQINGLKIAPRAPPISKLLYADDVLLFCGAKTNEVSSLLRCVEKYCVWSSQLVSIDKSDVFVSKGVHPHFCRQIKDQWGFKTLPKDAKYLRLPLFLTHKKAKDFSFVKERLESKVSG